MPNSREFCSKVAIVVDQLGLNPSKMTKILNDLITTIFDVFGPCEAEAYRMRLMSGHKRNRIPPYLCSLLSAVTCRAAWAAEENGMELSEEQSERIAVAMLDAIREATHEKFLTMWDEVAGHEETPRLLQRFTASKFCSVPQ